MALNIKIGSVTFEALLKPETKMNTHIKPNSYISSTAKTNLQQQRKQEARQQYQHLLDEIEQLKGEVQQLRQDNLALVEELRLAKPAIANPKR